MEDIKYYDNAYSDEFKISSLAPKERKRLEENSLSRFSTAGVIALNVVTINIFGTIYYGLKHGALPMVQEDDFGAGKAIGFLFIPVFNFYWVFRFWIRLVKRINFQLTLRNEEFRIPSWMPLTVCILTIPSMIPVIGLIVVLINFVLMQVLIGYVQHGINIVASVSND